MAPDYSSRITTHDAELAILRRADRLTGTFRLVAFLLGFVFLILVLDTRALLPWGLLLGITLIAFVIFVFRTIRIRSDRAHRQALRDLNQQGLDRRARKWDGLPEGPIPGEFATPVATDLDVIGNASAIKLLGGAGTLPARERLLRWLLHEPDPASVIQSRQDAARELAGAVDFRQELQASATRLQEDDPAPFLAWTRSHPTEPIVAAFWVPVAIALTVGMVILSALAMFQIIPLPIWFLGFIMTLVIGQIPSGRIHAAFDSVARGSRVFNAYGRAFHHLHQASFESAQLSELASKCANADTELGRLESFAGFAELRQAFYVYYPTLGICPWNILVGRGYHAWRERNRERVPGWFESLTQFDSLCALADLHANQPDWAFPTFSDGPVIRAAGLGHPLLQDDARVCNDLVLGEPESVLLVTGSNMSGKSTFLRSIGLNVLLAQAGAPVCASAMSLPRCRLATSIQILDSLEEGTSFFMAQLTRLHEVVESARHGHRETDSPELLFLLDEILSGTNSAERQVAVRRILRHLTDLGSFGAITTHDLELAHDPDVGARTRAVHFREQFQPAADGQPARMTFDYHLRPGISPTVNALKFLEVMGLDEETLRRDLESVDR